MLHELPTRFLFDSQLPITPKNEVYLSIISIKLLIVDPVIK